MISTVFSITKRVIFSKFNKIDSFLPLNSFLSIKLIHFPISSPPSPGRGQGRAQEAERSERSQRARGWAGWAWHLSGRAENQAVNCQLAMGDLGALLTES